MAKKKQIPHRYKSATEKMKDCSHAIFCCTFGEYKCDMGFHRIQNAELECVNCKNHVRRSTDDQDKLCHCEACLKYHEPEEI